MSKKGVVFFVAAMALLFAGCVSLLNVWMPASFWQETDKKIGVVILEDNPVPQMYREGGQGLLDMVIDKAAAGSYEKFLQTVDVSLFDAVADKFVNRLSVKGFNVKALGQRVYRRHLGEFKGDKKKFAQVDFRSLAAAEGVDRLLVITMDSLGTIRNYYGFIPISKPSAVCVLTAQLVNLSDNSLIWAYQMNISKPESRVAIDGNWDEPPVFPKVKDAINKAIDNAIGLLQEKFFVAI